MLTKPQLTKMMAEMAAVGAKYGVKVAPAGGSMGAGGLDAKIKFTVNTLTADASGKVVVAVTAAAKSYAKFDGIDVDKKFTHGGLTHRIVDYHPRKYKQPYITEASNGKRFKWSAVQIKTQMGLVQKATPQNTTDRLSHLLAQ